MAEGTLQDLDAAVDGGQQAPAQQEPFPLLGRALSVRSNPAAIALRQRSLQDQELIAQQRFSNEAQKMELEKVHAMTELVKEQDRISQGMEKRRQTMLAAKALSSLDPTDPKWEGKLLEAQAANPIGFEDDIIKTGVAHKYNVAKLQEAANSRLSEYKAQQQAETDAALAREDALKNSRAATAGAESFERTKGELEAKAESEKVKPTALSQGLIESYAAAKSGAIGESDPQKKAGFQAQMDEFEKQYPQLKTGAVLPPPVPKVPLVDMFKGFKLQP